MFYICEHQVLHFMKKGEEKEGKVRLGKGYIL